MRLGRFRMEVSPGRTRIRLRDLSCGQRFNVVPGGNHLRFRMWMVALHAVVMCFGYKFEINQYFSFKAYFGCQNCLQDPRRSP